MTAHEAAIAALLASAVVICAISGAAIAVMPGFYRKLHFLAPPAILAMSAVVAAVIIAEGLTAIGLKSLLILLVMAISNPIITHAAARAKKVRDVRRADEMTKE